MSMKKAITEKQQIKSPFLSFCLLFYGSLSIQLRPVHSSQVGSLLNFAWNVFLIATTFYLLFLKSSSEVEKEVHRDPRLVKVFRKKPLFAMTFKVGLNFIFKFNYLFAVTYYLLVNVTCKQKLAYLLDAFRVEKFDSPRTSWKLFFLIVTFQQYATVQSIVQIRETLKSTLITISTIETVEKSVGKLANLNASLGTILSLPLLLSIFDYTLGILITLSCLFIHPVNLLNYANLLVVVFYLLLIAALQGQINTQLMELSTSLEDITERQLYVRSAGLYREHSEESAIIKCRAFRQVYLKYFKLSAFHLFTVNFRYFFALALFVASYIVLISGTL
ncbi:hypothetical protein TYRP_021996 [Tyrophagus putrescentiae]|nr:hypothetical protein TYRP_021996 [Tyrophagus putrescentiae]